MSKPWYQDGRRFGCTECGKCSTGAPGYVWLTEEDMQEIAAFLNLSIEAFSQKYVRQVGDRFSLLETRRDFDCVFLKDKKCQVYKARPRQCRTYPFWPHIVKSQEAWDNEKRNCEGISDEAPLISAQYIESLIQIKKND